MLFRINILKKTSKKLTDKEKKSLKSKYASLLKLSKDYTSSEDVKLIRKALDSSIEHWEENRTPAGEPYILHLLDIAILIVDQIGLGANSIVSALIVDLVEAGIITLDDVKKEYNEKVFKIVEGLVKIADINVKSAESQYDKYQKLLITIADDVRVILIKLAFILDYMRSLNSAEQDVQVAASMETYAIYAPLAHRLGLYNIKSELENLSMKYTENDVYKDLIKKLKNSTAKREKYIKKFCEPIEKELAEHGLKYEIKGRPKSVYSIWQKMKKQNVSFEEVYDIFAIRIILDSKPKNEKADCWRVYSVVADHYQPNTKRLRDWISIPKSNGYESLHTTVVGPEQKWVEVQIRTQRMDQVAEKGFAAHWRYKGIKSEKGFDEWLGSIREILESSSGNTHDVIDDFKLNLYSKEVFAFTPNGDLKKLPEGATVLDFAYMIHTDVGAQCTGAKINHKNVTIKQKIQNGDSVEIITSKSQKPKIDWLSFVVTSKAKTKIKSSLQEERLKEAVHGEELLKRRLKNWKFEFTDELIQGLLSHYKLKKPVDLYYNVAIEKVELAEIKEVLTSQDKEETAQITDSVTEKKITEEKQALPDDYMIIDDQVENVDYKLAKCCSPIFGDEIFGFVTVSEGIKIHRKNCPNARDMIGRYNYRVVKAKWNKSMKSGSFQTVLRVSGSDDIGMLSRISDVISKDMKVQVRSISIDSSDGMFDGKIKLYVDSTKHLDMLINKLKKEKGIYKVVRVELGED